MVRIKLCELMGKQKMTRKCLSEITGIRPNTIGDLYKEEVKKIDIQVLNQICEVFSCEICDVLEYIPDKKDSEV